MDRPDSFSEPEGDPYPTVPIPLPGTAGYPTMPLSRPAPAFPPGIPPRHRPADSGQPPSTPYAPMSGPPAPGGPYPPASPDAFVTEPLPIFRAPASFPAGGEYSVPTGGLPVPPGYPAYEGDWSEWVGGRADPAPYPGGGPESPTRPGPVSAPNATAAPETPPGPYPVESASWSTEPADTSESTPDPTEAPTARERLRRRREAIRRAPAAPPRAPAQPGQMRWATVLRGAAGMAALAGAAYVQFVVIGSGDDPRPSALSAAPVSAPTSGDCPAERIGNSVRGNGPGGDASGPEAILAFQHGYYVGRSGEQARNVVTPDAAVPSAADIQRGIDTIPAGTTHCITITPGAFVGQYTVVITEHRPGALPLSYNPQLVTTVQIGNRTLITAIGPMP